MGEIIKFVIKEKIGTLSQSIKGWSKEFNLVSWNDGDPKYDLREWDPKHEKMGKGITLTVDEVKRLKEMESIIEISPAVAFVRRAEENWPIEFVSDNVLQFDYESEDLLSGQIKYMDIIHPEDRERIVAEIAKYSQDRDVEEFSQEYRINTGYGNVRWVDDRTFVRRNSKGVVTHLQGIILDVTERKLET